MCFHISLTPELSGLQERFGAKFREPSRYAPFYYEQAHSNPDIPAITGDDPDNIDFLGWGLVPSWAKDAEKADEIRKHTYNARSDTIFEKPSFRGPIMNGRCLVLADGFFEWQDAGGKKYPYYIRLKSGEPFALAGIWDKWNGPDGVKKTFSIITTDANPLLARIHNTKKRMPAILPRETERKWLHKGLEKDEIAAMMAPLDESMMEAHTVSRLITSRTQERNVPTVIEKYLYLELERALRPAAAQKTLLPP